MSISLKKKIKKRLRQVWDSHIFSCFGATRKDGSDVSETTQITSESTTTQSLQILLIKTLQNQVEDREFQAQLRKTLLYLVTVLEEFSKSCPPHQHGLTEKLSKFTIAVTKNSFVKLKTNPLSALQDSNKPLCLTATSELFPEGAFGSGLSYNLSEDKAVQSVLGASSVTSSKLIQTQIISLSRFDVTGFKLDLIGHIRTLKQDVVTLRQLLFKVENFHSWGCRDALWKSGEYEGKFFEAKVRAMNFMKFYKLRKIDNGKSKSSRHVRRRRNI